MYGSQEYIREEVKEEICIVEMLGRNWDRTKMKYLDIIIDDRLRFKEHSYYMLKEIEKKRVFFK